MKHAWLVDSAVADRTFVGERENVEVLCVFRCVGGVFDQSERATFPIASECERCAGRNVTVKFREPFANAVGEFAERRDFGFVVRDMTGRFSPFTVLAGKPGFQPGDFGL